MPDLSKSGKLYQERQQPAFQKTMRSPGHQINLDANLVHKITLDPPFPLPDFCANGNPVPDTGRTQLWPHGDKYAK